MTFLVERLAELRRHLDHLDTLRPRVKSASDLRADLSLHNDLLFSAHRLTVGHRHCRRAMDLDRAVRASNELEPIRRFAAMVADTERLANS